MKAPLLPLLPLLLLSRPVRSSDRTPDSVANDVLDAVSKLWSTTNAKSQVQMRQSGSTSLSGVSSSGVVSLPDLSWEQTESNNTYVRCNPCRMQATRVLHFSFSADENGDLQELSVLVNTTGTLEMSFEATLQQPSTEGAEVLTKTETVASVPYQAVTIVADDGTEYRIGLSADVESVLLSLPVKNHAVDPLEGFVSAEVSHLAGFVYSPSSGGIQPFADQVARYDGEAFQIEDTTMDTARGFAAHVAIDLVQEVHIIDVASVASRVSTALQVFSSPGSGVLAGADALDGQSYLCLFDGDCPADEVCVSTGQCFSYTRAAQTYCSQGDVDCGSGDPGCDPLSDDNMCANGGTCNAQNCRVFHTHGDNLEKYNAVCCGEDIDADGKTQTCEFETVTHTIWAKDLKLQDVIASEEETWQLMAAIANIEGIICGMGDPANCVRLDSIDSTSKGYSEGMVATATVARNCGAMELYVMSIYDCFEECSGLGSLPGLFHSTSFDTQRRQLNSVERGLQGSAERRRQLQNIFDPIANTACPESNVVAFATDVSISVDAVSLDPINEAEVWSHVEPLDEGCVAEELLDLIDSGDVQEVSVPLIVQHGSAWAGEARYVGDVTDVRNGNTVCADTYGFRSGEWAAGIRQGTAYARLNMQILNSTDMMTRLPTYHTKFMFNWGSLPAPESSDTDTFSCEVDTNVDVALDLRVEAAFAFEPEGATTVRRECRFTDGRSIVPPAISLIGATSQARGNVLNLTDVGRCWQVSVTTVGNSSLSQGSCSCEPGWWRHNCEDNTRPCVPCPALPDHHYYTSDGGSFWNGCAFEACDSSICGVGEYLAGCAGTSPGSCVNCTSGQNQQGFQHYTDRGEFSDDCPAYIYVAEPATTTIPEAMMSAAWISSIVIGILVVASLTVMTVFIVLKKRQDRLNDVHQAMQLTSKSQLKPPTVTEQIDYDSFHGDIVID